MPARVMRRVAAPAVIALFAGALCAAAQAAPAEPSPTPGGWTTRALPMQLQLLAEYEHQWNERLADSRLNPGNIAQLRATSDEARLYPAGEGGLGPVKFRGEMKVSWRPYGTSRRDSSASTAGDIQELKAAMSFTPAAYVAVGRQRLGWGTGLIWNPTRIEPQKDPFRLTNRLRGADAARFEYVVAGATANVLFLPSQLGQPSAFAARVETAVHGVSGSVSTVSPGTGRWRLGYDASTAFDQVTVYLEGAVRGRTVRPWLDSLGGQHARPDASDLGELYHDVVVGSMATPGARVQLVAEYRYQRDYSTADEDDVFLRFLPRNANLYDPLGRGRHRLFVSGRLGEPGRSGVSLGAFVDPITHQSITIPGITLINGSYKADLQAFLFHDSGPVPVFRRQLQCVLAAYY